MQAYRLSRRRVYRLSRLWKINLLLHNMPRLPPYRNAMMMSWQGRVFQFKLSLSSQPYFSYKFHVSFIALYLLVSSVGPDLDPNCLTLWRYSWNNFSKKLIILLKISRRPNSMQNYWVGKELKELCWEKSCLWSLWQGIAYLLSYNDKIESLKC